MSIAIDIAKAAEAGLLALGVFGSRVTRSLETGDSYEDFPAALLQMGVDVPSGQPAPVTVEYRVFTLELEVMADGEVPHDACDAVLVPAHAVMMALAPQVSCGTVQWGYDEENPALGIVRIQYQITYRRQEGEL